MTGRMQSFLGISAVAFGVAALVQACSLGDVDLTGKACPCAAGWVCWNSVCMRPDQLPDAGFGGGVGGGVGGGTGGGVGGGTGGGVGGGTGGGVGGGTGGGVGGGTGGGVGGGTGGGVGGGTGGGGGMVEPPACLDEYPGVIFCDDFEDPGLTQWAETEVMGAAERVTDRARSGSASVHAYTALMGGRGFLTSSAFTLTGGDIYFRIFLYVEGSATLNEASFALVREAEIAGNGTALQVKDEYANIWVGPTMASVSSSTVLTNITIPRDTWACLEGHVVVSDTDGSAEYFIDGTRATWVDGPIDTRPDGGYDKLVVGLEYTSPDFQGPLEVWVDDPVVATQRVGCN